MTQFPVRVILAYAGIQNYPTGKALGINFYLLSNAFASSALLDPRVREDDKRRSSGIIRNDAGLDG